MKTQNIFLFVLVVICLSATACKKLLDVDSPKNQLTTDKVFADSISAKSALFNVYITLENTHYPSSNKYLSNYVDETISQNSETWNQSVVPATDPSNRGNWTSLYSVVYQCNMILEQLGNSSKLAAGFKVQVEGEARFLRSYANFHLVNVYGKVPLLLGTNVDVNKKALQGDPEAVYKQIIADLIQSRTQLPDAYPGEGRIRVNQACATALLSKVYLYQKQWTLAENLATELINSGNYTPLETPDQVFKSSSKESILQLESKSGYLTDMYAVFPSSNDVVPGYFFADNFMNSFEDADLRKATWIGRSVVNENGAQHAYYYPFKYQNNYNSISAPENLILFRIAEQYLIRAEARAMQGKLSGSNSALEDLNVLRLRAGLLPLSPLGLEETLEAIYTERRHELFFENGDRFFDLKRTGKLQQVMTSEKTTWKPASAFLPIPASEIIINPNLVQNEGY